MKQLGSNQLQILTNIKNKLPLYIITSHYDSVNGINCKITELSNDNISNGDFSLIFSINEDKIFIEKILKNYDYYYDPYETQYPQKIEIYCDETLLQMDLNNTKIEINNKITSLISDIIEDCDKDFDINYPNHLFFNLPLIEFDNSSICNDITLDEILNFIKSYITNEDLMKFKNKILN